MTSELAPQFFICDTCGRCLAECEFAETVEEFLCQWCASGIDEAEGDDEISEHLEA